MYVPNNNFFYFTFFLGSENSSPMLTSDPTSDSSDTGGSGKSNDEPNVNSVSDGWNGSSVTNRNENAYESFKSPKENGADANKNGCTETAKNKTKTKDVCNELILYQNKIFLT